MDDDREWISKGLTYEPQDSIRDDANSDEYEVTSVVAVPPRKRDFWKVLRGRYQPKVKRSTVMTLKGTDFVLRRVYTKEKMSTLFYKSPLLAMLEGTDETTVSIKKPA